MLLKLTYTGKAGYQQHIKVVSCGIHSDCKLSFNGAVQVFEREAESIGATVTVEEVVMTYQIEQAILKCLE